MDVSLDFALTCFVYISYCYYQMLKNLLPEVTYRNIFILIPVFFAPKQYLNETGNKYWKRMIYTYLIMFIGSFVILHL
jgi:hypothetical protein